MLAAEVIPLMRPDSEVVQTIGVVSALHEDRVTVQASGRSLSARRALSCLVEPAIDDRVWLVGQPGAYFIASVLERPSTTSVQLGLDGDVRLAARQGRLQMVAAQGIELVTPKELNLVADEFSLRAGRGRLLVDQLHCLGQRLLAELEQVKLLGRWFDSALERVSQRVKRSYRVVEEMDQVRSEQIHYQANKNLYLHGQNALMSAKDLVKVDAGQIHIG